MHVCVHVCMSTPQKPLLRRATYAQQAQEALIDNLPPRHSTDLGPLPHTPEALAQAKL